MTYARSIVAGRIPSGKYLKAACQRHLDDIAKSRNKTYKYRFDPARAHRICKFAEGMVHVRGKWAKRVIGNPDANKIRLQDWQCFFFCVLFGWIVKRTLVRRFKKAYSEIPRKNAKSTMASIIGNYMFLADGEEGAEVYSGATKEKQAFEVFKPSRLMVLKAPGLKKYFEVAVGIKNMAITGTASKYEPLVGDPGEGSSPSCAIIDEYHEHKTAKLYDAMDTGMGARDQPLLFVITTAGDNIAGPCYAMRDDMVKLIKGVEGFVDEECFVFICTIDEGDNWEDFEVWMKANPNYGVSVNKEYLQRQHATAMRSARKRNVLLCRHLNIWNRTRTAWMDIRAYRACKNEQLKLEDFKGCQCWIGLDLASKVDIAAMRFLFRRPIDEAREGLEFKYIGFGKYYLPEETIEQPDNEHYREWREKGFITETDGAIIDFEVIQDDLKWACKTFDVESVGYDPFQATEFATRMMKENIPMVEVGAIVKNFSEPMKKLEAQVISGLYEHDGDPVQTWQMTNVVAKIDAKDNIYPRKEFEKNKIDGVVAEIMAMNRATLAPEKDVSVYESRGLRSL